MNSQENRKVKASSASTTRFIAGEKGREERQDALRRGFVPAIADRITGSPPRRRD